MFFLLDTNIVSELRKRERMNPGVLAWFEATYVHNLFLSVITIGEIRRGIEEKRPSDSVQAGHLDAWMERTLTLFQGHLLPITPVIADRWGRLCPNQPLSIEDGLIAATALEHDMLLVTRNTKDFKRTGVKLLNPFT
jgi:predicted nucleic acid-binding protein